MKYLVLAIIFASLFSSVSAQKNNYFQEIILSCTVKEKGFESEYSNKNIQVSITISENGDGKYYLSIIFDGSEMKSVSNVINKVDPNKFEISYIDKSKYKDLRDNKIYQITLISSATINRNNGFISYETLFAHSDGTTGDIKGSGSCSKVDLNSRKF